SQARSWRARREFQGSSTLGTGRNPALGPDKAVNPRKISGNTEGARLDAVNCALLAELQDNARLSLAELGRRVGLSSPAVTERLTQLEQRGVIERYQAMLNPAALGLTLTAVIRVRPSPGQLQNVGDLARKTPEVVECHRVTGDDC